MIDADTDVITAHSDSQFKLQMSERMWRPSSLFSNNMVQELITCGGAMHPHHLYLFLVSFAI